MQLTSTAFDNEGVIPKLYTCQGKEINPPLNIQDVPREAQSLALIMDDPDVPKTLREDGLWVHWVVYNIPVSIKEIAENSKPPGVEGLNTSGAFGYQGPCPPDREHRYFFKLYALDTFLPLLSQATKTSLIAAMQGHILAETTLMGRYTICKKQ